MRTLILLLLALPLSAQAWDRCSESRQVEQRVDLSQIAALNLTARAGELRIEGSDRQDLALTARLCSSDEEALARMSVDQSTKNGVLHIAARIPWDEDDFDPRYAYIDLELQVPASLLIDLRDSSGDIHIQRAAVRHLQDSSGEIHIEDGRSELTILDTSGEIRVDGNAGNLTVTDSSGDMTHRDIQGHLRVLSDSSGDIDIRQVSGRVEIDRDSSGDIDIRDAASVQIGSDSSGSIEVREVRGNVNIDEDSSGNIDASQVAGNFRVGRKGNGKIRTDDVAGEISVP